MMRTITARRCSFAKPESTDPTLGAFRVNAATAPFSRIIATQIYGDKRPYIYAFGESGGAYRTVGLLSAEQQMQPGNMGKVVATAWNVEGLSKEVEKQPGWSFEKSDAFPFECKIDHVGKIERK